MLVAVLLLATAWALRLSPDYAEAHGNLGVVLAQKGHRDEAIVHYTEALRLKPDLAPALNNLGVAIDAQQRHLRTTTGSEE